MSRDEAVAVLSQAGFLVERWGKQWWIVPPPGSPGARLQPGGALLPEWILISVAGAVSKMTPIEYRPELCQWN